MALRPLPLSLTVLLSALFSFGHRQLDLVDASVNALRELRLLEVRRDHSRMMRLASTSGSHLPAVADFDAEFFSFIAISRMAPLSCLLPIFQHRRRECHTARSFPAPPFHDQHRSWPPVACSKGNQFGFSSCLGRGAENACGVGHPRRQRWIAAEVPRRRGAGERQHQQTTGWQGGAHNRMAKASCARRADHRGVTIGTLVSARLVRALTGLAGQVRQVPVC